MKNKDNKSEVINFRVTQTLKEELEVKAAEKAISLSAYLSIMLSEYENQHRTLQRERERHLETVTQKQIIEKSLSDARRDGQMMTDTNFNSLYESLRLKTVNGKTIYSKADLLGVLALSVKITLPNVNQAQLQIPLQVSTPQQMPPQKMSLGALFGFFALLLTALGAIIYFMSRKTKKVYSHLSGFGEFNSAYSLPGHSHFRPLLPAALQQYDMSEKRRKNRVSA